MFARVSIIMGIYNCESTLAEAIDSILSQTYMDWKLIMCDDGSEDNTYKLAWGRAIIELCFEIFGSDYLNYE